MSSHRKYQRIPPDEMVINPEEYYTVAKASAYLGKSRMSIYRYLAAQSSTISSQKIPGQFRQLIKGADLIAFKAEGLPKLGRRRLSTPTLEKNLNSKNKGEISATLLSPEDTSD